SRLIPYNGEFETEEELIKIINKLSDDVNNEINQTTKVRPIMLIKKEKEYLFPMPNIKIIESYINYINPVKVHKDSMIYYKGKRYSVPHKFINKTLKIRELNNKLYVYNNTNLIRIHPLTQKIINYHEDDYKKIMVEKLPFKNEEDIEAFTIKNLKMLDKLKG
ncbi:Mu transposase domain-containing protein, partial [Defluviitalea phaphyphila]|uniref:Mu transposase domain-containing protein n=1 Tax=Defluviitalea phaphyphila TaxID=1473580 RepID=UPI0038B952C6